MAGKKQVRCRRGHLFSVENTYINPNTGIRCCRTCQRWHDANRAQAKATFMRRWFTNHPEAYKQSNLRRALKRFGLTEEQHAILHVAQHGLCAICGKPEGIRRMDIDHDHTSGAVRGLLCANCNRVLGYSKEDTAVLAAAIKYLEQYKSTDQVNRLSHNLKHLPRIT